MSDMDVMELAWGVDIDAAVAMVSIAFGKPQFSFLTMIVLFYIIIVFNL